MINCEGRLHEFCSEQDRIATTSILFIYFIFCIKLVLSDVTGSGDAEILRVGWRSTCDTLSRDPYIKSYCISTTVVLAL